MPSTSSISPSTTTTTTSSSAEWKTLISENDLPFEEDLLQNAFNVKTWIRYLGTKSDPEALYFIYERALKEIPGSYKIWKCYLDLRREQIRKVLASDQRQQQQQQQQQQQNDTAMDVDDTSSQHKITKSDNAGQQKQLLHLVDTLNHCYERALAFMHKMPRIWLDFTQFLQEQGAITRTRRTFDRALRSLPITQHKRIWEPYLNFAKSCGVMPTSIRVQKRYLKLEPTYAEDFIEFLLGQKRWNEAAEQMIILANNEPFASTRGKTAYQLWMEISELLCEHPKDIKTIRVEPILRSGIQRFTDQVGKLWNALARYWILLGNLEKARDVFEEAMASVITVRDFTQVFDSYAEFEESILTAKMNRDGETDDLELDLRLARFEKLMDRRPFLVNDVHLRQNPNNVLEWMKRIELWGDNQEKVIETYQTALETIKPKKAFGRFQDLWISFAKLQEEIAMEKNQEEPDLEAARDTYEKALQVQFRHPDSLAECYIAYAEMELRHENTEKTMEIMGRGTTMPRNLRRPINSINYLDESIPVHQRLFKSIKLWSFYVDVEESFGTIQSAKAVYDRILDLKICTPQTIVNYGTFLEDNNFFEESYKVYERGIDLFGYPIAFDLWNIYLEKFMDRYGGSKLERARDLFEHALEKCPAKYAKAVFLLYGKLEETYGLSKKAMQVYDRATGVVPPEEKFEMFNYYIAKAVDFFGLPSARAIYEKALESLPDKHFREMCVRFAELEIKLGELDRARAIYGHASQMCDPRVDPGFWKLWHDFEVRHGNEETFKEMLRIKRSVQAQYNSDTGFLSQQMLANRAAGAKGGAAAVPLAKPSMTFISGGKTMNGKKLEKEEADAAAAAKAAPPVNPEEIVMDDMSEDEEVSQEQANQEKTPAPAKPAFVGAKDRFKAKTEASAE